MRTKKDASKKSGNAKKNKSDDSESLTIIERLKLVRNCIVFIIVIAAFFVFLKNSIVASEEIDLIIIFSSIMFTLIAFLLFIYFIKHLMDLKNGVAEIDKGSFSKKADDIFTANLPISMIILDRQVHFICIHHYFRIKEGDFIVIRRAPISRCIVSLQITHKEKR